MVENRSRQYICDRLDEVGEIILATQEEVEKNNEKIWDLPVQYGMGKHGENSYRIVKLLKNEDGYFAHGVMTDDDTSSLCIELFGDIDSMVLAELADLI